MSYRRSNPNVRIILSFVFCLADAFGVAHAAPAGKTNPKVPAASDLAVVEGVELQPLVGQTKRLLEALDYIGQPLLSKAEKKKILDACESSDAEASVATIQQVLDPHCLVGVSINAESRVKVALGSAKPALVEQGWRTFLVKVQNDAGVTAVLKPQSGNARPVHRQDGGHEPKPTITDADIRDRWMDIHMFNDRPLTPKLSGLHLEYRIMQVFSRDAGKHEATVAFNVGQGTQDLGFRNDVSILFDAQASNKLKLHVLDEDGKPTTASFIIRDDAGRVYPSQTKRLAPDFFFHAQIYRADGESITLPPGNYHIEYTRGPEYLIEKKTVSIAPDAADAVETFQLHRWIHPSTMGWYSGDHHVHAAGCAHYADPSQGVKPEDMMRHIMGEDLNIGCVLSWGPCWYFQKMFFEGKISPLSKPNHIMRYDVEVSGFPSDYTGHLCLIGLKEDDYTYPKETEFDYAFDDDKGHFKGTKTSRIGQWPTWDLPILQFGKAQGAVVGFSHSGWGLQTRNHNLPNMEIPPFDGIGANEYIVDVTHDGVVDFISSVDTPWPFELNIWYHTNNAGFRTRLSGETDFPCIYGERVGLGRIYAKVDGDGPVKFDPWLASMKAGRSYVCDGKAHLMDFQVNDRMVGTEGSELSLASPSSVKVKMKVAAFLDEKADEEIHSRPINEKPYWNVERARVNKSRRVPVEIIVNGISVARKEIEADGKSNDLEFDVPLERSSWVAARIFASAHTNPVYVIVGDKPIRASRKSLQWCLDSVEQCWRSKSGAKNRLRPSEHDACKAAYDHAREVYKKLLAECEVD